MRRPDLRIRIQLTVSVCLFTVVCVISLAIAIYVLSRNTLLNIQSGNLDLNSRMLQEECRQEFEDIYESFYRLSYSSPVQRIYSNYTNSDVLLSAANVLHDSFGPDRILLLKLYLTNGSEILEVDSRSVINSTFLPKELFPIANSGGNINRMLSVINDQYGLFSGPLKAGSSFEATQYVLSLSLPIKNDTVYAKSELTRRDQLIFGDSPYGTVSNVSVSANSTSSDGTIGYATFLINSLKIERTLSSISQGSAVNDISASALCVEHNNFTEFEQLIPFSDNVLLTKNVSMDFARSVKTGNNFFSKINNQDYMSNIGTNFPIDKGMARTLREGKVPRAGVNRGPNKSMISISPFTVLYTTYYVVVLQPHRGVFHMLHRLRNIIVLASCVIGAGMIIFTFLFVSFGARQILRLKMAATYENPTPSKWKFLTIPWWLRPSANRKSKEELDDKSEFRVPEQVPLRKHVRDELDDITERFNTMSNELRKQYERLEDRVEARKAEIEQAREAADIANAAKSHFLARVTHELRTPLNGIIGTATLCLQEDNIQQIHQSLRTIFKCGELLLHLMTDLLSFSQNEVENLDLEMRDFTLPEITSQLKAIFTEQCVTKNINLMVDDCAEYEDLVFSGDTNRISQVIFNLMSNGIKFTPEGGHVYFHAEVKDCPNKPKMKQLTFIVKDNGPGIAPEMQHRVFEAFVQGDISSHVKKAGVGLGLSICRQLAERMDGNITLESELGKGSAFIFKLALAFHIAGTESVENSFREGSETASAISILRKSHSHHNTGSNLNSPVQESPTGDKTGNGLLGGSAPGFLSSINEKPIEKSAEAPTRSARSVLSRTISSTSHITRGLLTSSRRLTQDSIFRSGDGTKFRTDTEPPLPNTSIAPIVSGIERNAAEYTKDTKQRTAPNESSKEGVATKAITPPRAASIRSAIWRSSVKSNTGDSSGSSDSPVSGGKSTGDSSAGNSSSGQFPIPTFVVDKPDTGKADIRPPPLKLDTKATGLKGKTGIDSAKLSSSSNSKSSSGVSNDPFVRLSNSAKSMEYYAPHAHSAAPAPAPPTLPTTVVPSQSSTEPPLNINVLVVDDNLVNQEVMVRMLNLEGLKSIKVANDGLDAIEMVKQAQAEGDDFDVIFMDVQMPNMDGRQATRIIRNEMKLSVPIVAVSAYANEKNADDCIAAGMNLFLSKPLRRPHLRVILRSVTTANLDEAVAKDPTVTTSEPA